MEIVRYCSDLDYFKESTKSPSNTIMKRFLVVYIFMVCSPDLKIPSRYTRTFDKVNIWYSRIRTPVNTIPCLPRNAFYFFIP